MKLLLVFVVAVLFSIYGSSYSRKLAPSRPIKTNETKVETEQQNIGVTCALRCMDKIKLPQVNQCKLLFNQGKNLNDCSWKKLRNVCYNKCRYGATRCWKVCSKKDCFGKQVTVCNSHCKKNKQCRRECKFRKVKSCFFDRIPGKFVKTCSSIWKSKTFKGCLKGCTNQVTHCSKKCAKVKVVKKYKRCQRYLVERACESQKCSFGQHYNKCSAFCAKKKICGTKCEYQSKGGKKVCKYTCWSGKNCLKRCSASKQLKCYLLRIPEKYKKRCWKMLKSEKVNKCYNKCFKVAKLLSRRITTKKV